MRSSRERYPPICRNKLKVVVAESRGATEEHYQGAQPPYDRPGPRPARASNLACVFKLVIAGVVACSNDSVRLCASYRPPPSQLLQSYADGPSSQHFSPNQPGTELIPHLAGALACAGHRSCAGHWFTCMGRKKNIRLHLGLHACMNHACMHGIICSAMSDSSGTCAAMGGHPLWWSHRLPMRRQWNPTGRNISVVFQGFFKPASHRKTGLPRGGPARNQDSGLE